MKSKFGMATVVTIVVAVPLIIQWVTINRLSAGRGNAVDIHALQRENETLRQREALAKELAGLQRDHEELISLRARNEGIDRKVELKTKLAGAEKELTSVKSETAALAKEVEAKEFDVKMASSIKKLSMAAFIYKKQNKTFPTNFGDLTNKTPVKFPEGVLPEQFELVQHSEAPGTKHPGVILFKEKSPRPGPDGTLSRYYGLADGSVHKISERDGSFDWFERPRIITETPQP